SKTIQVDYLKNTTSPLLACNGPFRLLALRCNPRGRKSGVHAQWGLVQMKTLKSVLLGSAAGLIAVSATQAADLPVKAKPVEYVKICSLYGDGFLYIPGTDICLKVGGYVRSDYGWNVTGARTVHYTGGPGAQDRSVSPYSTRHRAHFNFDSRT